MLHSVVSLLLCGKLASAIVSRIDARLFAPAPSPAPAAAASPYRQALRNVGDVQYFGNVTVGGQTLQAVIDTGSFELLVFAKRCHNCGETALYYDGRASASHQGRHLVTRHSFGSGDALSRLANDVVAVGPLVVEGQYFWEVFQANMPVISDGTFQAIFGVGPPGQPLKEAQELARSAASRQERYEAAGEEVPLTVQREVQRSAAFAATMEEEVPFLQQTGVNVFSVCLQQPAGSDGLFVWNDADAGLKPDVFAEMPVVGEVTWGVNLSSSQLSSSNFNATIGCEHGCGAIIDSGTSLLAVPASVAEAAYRVLEDLDADCNNIDELPSLELNLGGTTFRLPPSAYLGEFEGEIPDALRHFISWRPTPKRFCSLQVLLMVVDAQTQFGPLWIVGMPFFREYYTTFSLGGSSGSRTIHAARHDGQCEPLAATSGSTQLRTQLRTQPKARPGQLRKVDLSKVRLPQWALTAASAQRMTI